MTRSNLLAIATIAVVLGGAVVVSCGGPEDPASKAEIAKRYGEPKETVTSEPVSYTDTPYDFTGKTSIADLYALFDDSAFVWYGMSSESGYPISGPCESFGNEVVPVDELPVEIEGVVTLHPRYFQKTSWCGEDERYYGSYTLEDETGGILVLKDSRIADFTYGDRVKLKVYGLLKYFDTYAVVTHTDEEVVSRGNDVYYEELPDDQELISDDVARTFRWTGEVAVEPSNSNFNEICMVEKGGDYTACDPRCVASDMCGGSWLVSIDRELGQRDPMPIHQGQILQVTGPVVNSFGLRFLVARLGQLQLIDE